MSRFRLLALSLVLCLAAAGATVAPQQPKVAPSAASTSTTRIVITERLSPNFEGKSFGGTGQYEYLIGTVEGELDPTLPRNQRITNLDRAPRNARGNVEYKADIQIIKPIDMSRSNHAIVFDVTNRGNKRITGLWVNGGPSVIRPTTAEESGTGWLMREGYTIVWVGWEGLIAPGGNRTAAMFPVARNADGSSITARTTQEFQFGADTGPATATLSYPAASTDRTKATLTVRGLQKDARKPLDSWEFVNDKQIRITKPAGYDAGAIYEFVYTAKDPIVLGLGLASISNAVAHLRHANTPDNPLAGAIDRALIIGFSQSGRVVRDLIKEGFNADESGRQVFSGAIAVLAGSRRTNINTQFGITGDYSRQHETHLMTGDQFPFTYEVMTDPISGKTDGILARCRTENNCPKIFHVDSDTEVFQARTSLVATTPDGKPAAFPDNVRAFFIAGSQHGAANTPTKPDDSETLQNPLRYDMYFRALISAMDDWATDGKTPPASHFPSLQDGTLVPPTSAKAQFPKIPGHHYTGTINELHLVDYSVQPPKEGAAYPVFVVAKDADGNNAVGLRHPFVEVPTATYTGWANRPEGFGKDDLSGLNGSYLPFAKTRAERMASGDARPSLEERYKDHAAYIDAVTKSANAQVQGRILLQEDADRIIAQAKLMAWPSQDTAGN